MSIINKECKVWIGCVSERNHSKVHPINHICWYWSHIISSKPCWSRHSHGCCTEGAAWILEKGPLSRKKKKGCASCCYRIIKQGYRNVSSIWTCSSSDVCPHISKGSCWTCIPKIPISSYTIRINERPIFCQNIVKSTKIINSFCLLVNCEIWHDDMERCSAITGIKKSYDNSIEHKDLIIATDISLVPRAFYRNVTSARIRLHVCDWCHTPDTVLNVKNQREWLIWLNYHI